MAALTEDQYKYWSIVCSSVADAQYTTQHCEQIREHNLNISGNNSWTNPGAQPEQIREHTLNKSGNTTWTNPVVNLSQRCNKHNMESEEYLSEVDVKVKIDYIVQGPKVGIM